MNELLSLGFSQPNKAYMTVQICEDLEGSEGCKACFSKLLTGKKSVVL